MMFGNRDVFAVEAEFLEIHGKWIYGKLRLWIGGASIGDFEDTSDLATSARWGRAFLEASSQRTRAELDEVGPEEVYELLYGRYIEPVNTSVPKPWPGRWDRDPYILDDFGESALRDRWAVVVVRRGDGTDRVLFNCFDEGHVVEALIPQGECDLAIEAYCEWVEKLSRTR